MILIFLSALLTMYSAQIFTLSFSIHGLNRAVIATPIELMYNAVNFTTEGGYFNKITFQDTVNKYYDNILPRYCKEHEVSFYYYNPEDGSMCLSKTCSGVEISIKCKLTITYEYNRTMFYELRGKNNG